MVLSLYLPPLSSKRYLTLQVIAINRTKFNNQTCSDNGHRHRSWKCLKNYQRQTQKTEQSTKTDKHHSTLNIDPCKASDISCSCLRSYMMQGWTLRAARPFHPGRSLVRVGTSSTWLLAGQVKFPGHLPSGRWAKKISVQPCDELWVAPKPSISWGTSRGLSLNENSWLKMMLLQKGSHFLVAPEVSNPYLSNSLQKIGKAQNGINVEYC